MRATEHRPEASVGVAMLLSAAGGFLDAFTWIGHGGVFANAQTGNVVLLGVFASSGQWARAGRHVPPLVAFVFGVFLANRLRVIGGRREGYYPALISLGVEIALLLLVACLPGGFADWPIVMSIAFVAAVQSSSFAKVESWSYSSVMTTGNLRRSAEALFSGLFAPREPGALHEAAVFGVVCLTFGLGATCGAFATARAGNLAVLAPAATLALAMALCLRAWRAPAGR